jgi:hypothetical protein
MKGMQDIRGVVKSEKQFHKYWLERQKQRERRKEKHERAEIETNNRIRETAREAD